MAFFTPEEWKNAKKSNGSIMKWIDIPQEQIFCLISMEKKENMKYETYILNFVDDQQEEYSCYCPSHFLRHIRKTRSRCDRPYFVSYGMCKKGDFSMASFEVSYKEEQKAFDIFE